MLSNVQRGSFVQSFLLQFQLYTRPYLLVRFIQCKAGYFFAIQWCSQVFWCPGRVLTMTAPPPTENMNFKKKVYHNKFEFPVPSIVKPTRCTSFSNLFYFGITLYMFRTVFPSIIRSSRLYIQQKVYVVQILLPACQQQAGSSICMTYTFPVCTVLNS